MNIEQKTAFIQMVRAATHGMTREEKRKNEELLLAGGCLMLEALSEDSTPLEWKALLMTGRAHKLFGKRI